MSNCINMLDFVDIEVNSSGSEILKQKQYYVCVFTDIGLSPYTWNCK